MQVFNHDQHDDVDIERNDEFNEKKVQFTLKKFHNDLKFDVSTFTGLII